MKVQLRLRHVSSLFLLACGALPAQSERQWQRVPQPPTDQTIFSPIDLPTPNRTRSASGAPGPDYWQQEASYAIDVSLDPAARAVRGREHVTYVNRSPDQLDYLWVHLEQNILRPDSIGSLVGGREAVGGPSEPSDGVTIHEVAAGGEKLEYVVYDTMMRVEVPQPIAANGGVFEFDVAWEFTIPERVFRRYGTERVAKGTVWEIAQWFPAVAVYDDVHGWNTLPYIGTGEFYTNFGTYDVSISVPRDHLVVATGVLQNPGEVYTEEQRRRLEQARESAETVVIRGQEEVGDPRTRPSGDGPLVWRFHAENVRTFAWASSEAFILDAASWGDVLLQSAYPEEALPAWSKSTQMLRAAIGGYSRRWLPYPYPVATNVFGAEGGMEYPMIIFCGGTSEGSLWGVTTHEIGHTWFPMVVNTDERRHAWMDEGFDSFINFYSQEDWFGSQPQARTGLFGAAMRGLAAVPIETEADQLDGLLLGALQYQKTAAGLQLLREDVLGPERFDYAFRTYIRRWAFKSPRPSDFFRTMEDASGMDLDWFWRGWFLESVALDQAVDAVRQVVGKRPPRVYFTNLERMVMPLTFRATFEDGTTEDQQLPVQVWFRSNRVAHQLDTPKRLQKIEIDPDRRMPDVDRQNNTWTAEG